MPQSDPKGRSFVCCYRDALIHSGTATTGFKARLRRAWLDAGFAKYWCAIAFDIVRLLALTGAFIVIISSGCSGGHATLDLTAPSTSTAGTPFTMTVQVLYQGKPDTVINGVIHFTSSDPTAVLPIDYKFTPADAGSHTWNDEFILSTPGNQTISGAIHDAIGINGSATISVSP